MRNGSNRNERITSTISRIGKERLRVLDDDRLLDLLAARQPRRRAAALKSSASMAQMTPASAVKTTSDQREVHLRLPFGEPGNGDAAHFLSTCSTARNASCGISTEPTCFMRFLPAFCFSSSLRLRVTSPP